MPFFKGVANNVPKLSRLSAMKPSLATRTFKRELVAALPRLRRFALTLAGSKSASDDLLQTTCERALSRWQQWREGSHLDRWAMRIMHSIWMNELRAQRIRSSGDFNEAEQIPAELADRQIEAHAELDQVLRVLMGLPEAQRTCLLLVYAEGMSYREAAEVMDVPVGTVMSRIARGRQTLTDKLTAPDEAPFQGVSE